MRSTRASWGVVGLAIVAGACTREVPQPQPRARKAPVVEQGRPPDPDPAATVEAPIVDLRTGRTRVGEAVRLHVSGWRASDGPDLAPTIELDGPAAIERMGSELVEERDGRVRERVDFRIEPSAAGLVGISVTVATESATAAPPAKGVERHDLTLVIAEALGDAELERELSTRAARLERGRRLAKQGDYQRAIVAFELALEREPDDPTVLGELGWAAFLAGDRTLARRATRQGLRLESDPKARGALLYNLGRIAEVRGRDDEAIEAYRRSLEVRPGIAAVQERLTKLEAGRPTPSCSAPICPLSAPVDAIRACEQIEEEACRRGACTCDVDELAKLEPLGPWRLLALTEDDATLVQQVFVLIADAPAAAGDPRYQVFPPLSSSNLLSQRSLSGGVREAALIETAGVTLLRIDFERSNELDVELAWTLLCALTSEGPVCATPLLRAWKAPGQPGFAASLDIGENGFVSQTIEAGVAPELDELALDFPGVGIAIATEPTTARALLGIP